MVELRTALVVLLLELFAQKSHFRHGRAHFATGTLEDLLFLADDLIVDLVTKLSRKRPIKAMFGSGLEYAGARRRCGNGVVGRHDQLSPGEDCGIWEGGVCLVSVRKTERERGFTTSRGYVTQATAREGKAGGNEVRMVAAQEANRRQAMGRHNYRLYYSVQSR